MKLNLDKVKNNSMVVILLLLVFSALICISCISATDADGNDGNCIYNDSAIQDKINNSDYANNSIIKDIDSVDNSDSIKSCDSSVSDVEIENQTYPHDSSNAGLKIKDGVFTLHKKGSQANGYHWEVSPETYGVDLVKMKYEPNYIYSPTHPPRESGDGTFYFTFHVNDDYDGHFFAKVVLINPSGRVVDEVDSNMINVN